VLQALGVTQKTRSTFVLTDPTEILEALVGSKDVRVLHYERRASDVEQCIEQVVDSVRYAGKPNWRVLGSIVVR
jgi:hypothetical protein